ncbi:MAG: alpha/beta hydrolase-fold protein [Bryobacteraceae bacterium]|nr:alpha/beta hydrolase-fold protein [Bryobacteraceae bacterium]
MLTAKNYAPGPQVLTFVSEADGSEQPYALYLPPRFDPSSKYPMVVSLHGAFSNHRLNLRRVFGVGHRSGESDAEASRYFPPLREVNYIVAAPLARGTIGYQGLAEEEVYAVMADVMRRFPVDEDRVYLTGLSMGGGGALWLGLTRPDLWAAVAAVCPAVPPGTEELAPNALNLPIRLFHGDLDPVVPVAVSRRWHKTLFHLGTTVEYVEYPGIRHNSWDYAYANGRIFDWFDRFRRNRYPDRVRFLTRWYKYRKAYWAEIDGLTPSQLASLDVRFAGWNRLEAETRGVEGFTLHLTGHPRFDPARAVAVKVDGRLIKVKPQAAVSFVKQGDSWRLGRYVPPPGSKRPGLEGPAREAVSARHIYVYGTVGAKDQVELRRRRAQAEAAADWSSAGAPALTAFRVAADTEVTENDLLTSHLVLFGTWETNRLIARFRDRFPMELNPGAADYGLVFVAPANGRSVVVNSGLPWWTGAERASRPGLPFLRAPVHVLASFGDYVLFKASLDNVVVEGFFDSNWRLKPEEAARLAASGAVTLR